MLLNNCTQKQQGIIWFCIAGFLSVVINLNMRYLNQTFGYHPFQLVFSYSLLGAALYLPAIMKGRMSFATTRAKLYNIRALLEIGGFVFMFFALSQIPFAVLVSITFTTPLIGTIFAVYMLGENMNAQKIIGLVVGFVGIIVVSNPFGAKFSMAYLLPVLAACCFAMCGVLIRIMSRTEPPTRIAARTLAMMALFSLPLALTEMRLPDANHLPYFLAIAGLVALVQFAVGNALQKIELTVAHPFMFLNLIWSSSFAWLLFDEKIDIITIFGAIIIIVGIVINSYNFNSIAHSK
jgi:drug/metabolite transporter (DMT)-like permease